MRKRAAAAFSLIEVIVAITVLVIAIMATLAVLAMSSQARTTSRETELATEFLRAKIQEYRGKDWADIGPDANLEGNVPGGTATWTTIPAGWDLENSGGEYMVDILTDIEADGVFAGDINGDGVVDANDVFDLDGDADVATEDYNIYAYFPIRISIRWDPMHMKGQSLTDDTKKRTMVAETLIYPASTN